MRSLLVYWLVCWCVGVCACWGRCTEVDPVFIGIRKIYRGWDTTSDLGVAMYADIQMHT